MSKTKEFETQLNFCPRVTSAAGSAALTFVPFIFCPHSSQFRLKVGSSFFSKLFQPQQVCLRAPVSESLSRLHREQLQKFAQYLISELPQQILPTAQRLLDMLLSPHPSPINMVRGAPDPTAGASANDQTSWYLDDKTLHDNIKKILIKFCVPAPIVFR
jgi:hypothetical protein